VVDSAPRTRATPTVRECWNDYVAAQEPAWRGRKTKAGWVRSIESHAASIADKPVSEIDVEDVLSVLRPLWMTKAESAGKLRERLERVLDYAKVRKLRSGENPAAWKGNLVHLLPPRPKLQRGHMRAIPYQQVPELMEKLAKSSGMSARALEFTILTVARESMTLEATWGEVHEDVWELDASRMKERAFRQPLSKGALRVLQSVKPPVLRLGQLIFVGSRGGVMSNMAMDMLLRDLAPPYTPHGMRSAFRDWAGDETDFAREVVEECLAHTVGDETERAYRRGDALKKRRAVLEAWSSYCLQEG
jgi:integrase